MNLFLKLLLTLVITSNYVLSFAQQIQTLDIRANDMIYASDIDRIYFIGANNWTHLDSLCTLDPQNGEIDHCYFIGNKPMSMAISNDEQYIYIGLRNEPRIVRFNRNTEEIDQDFSLGGNAVFGNYFARDIEVSPNNPNLIAVSKSAYFYGWEHQGVAIYENGILKMEEVSSNDADNRSITFGTDDKTLFGFYKNNSSFDDGFNMMTVYNEGVELDTIYNDLLEWTNDKIEYSDGIVYSRDGYAIDVSVNPPQLKGIYDVGNIFGFGPGAINQGAVEPSKNSDRVFFANSVGGFFDEKYWVHVFDKSSFQLVDTFAIQWSGVASGPRAFFEMINLGQNDDLAILAKLQVAQPDGVTPGLSIVLVKNIPVGINTPIVKNNFNLFPNPITDEFSIQMDSPFNYPIKIRLIDLLGKELESWSRINLDNTTSFKIENYPSGIYLIQILNDRNQIIGNKKVIKN